MMLKTLHFSPSKILTRHVVKTSGRVNIATPHQYSSLDCCCSSPFPSSHSFSYPSSSSPPPHAPVSALLLLILLLLLQIQLLFFLLLLLLLLLLFHSHFPLTTQVPSSQRSFPHLKYIYLPFYKHD